MSNRFEQLKRGEESARKHFLPKIFNPTGSYKIATYHRVLAYYLLVHAEIESYIEDSAYEIAKTKVTDATQSDQYDNKLLLCLIAWFTLRQDQGDEHGERNTSELQNAFNRGNLQELLHLSLSHFKHVTDANHGILKKNLKKILPPITIKMADLDETWLNEMDSFGSLRGKYAHSPLSSHMRTPPDPQDAIRRVQSLFNGLADLDIIFERLGLV